MKIDKMLNRLRICVADYDLDDELEMIGKETS